MRRQNGWQDYKKLIIYRLDEQSEKIDSIVKTLEGMGEDVASLKIKASIAGGMAGLVGTGLLSVLAKLLQ